MKPPFYRIKIPTDVRFMLLLMQSWHESVRMRHQNSVKRT